MAMIEYITTAGQTMLARMLAGDCRITFTKVQIGDGDAPDCNFRDVTELTHCLADLEIESVKLTADNTVKVAAIFSNVGMDEGFYYKEKALWISDGEDEVLFSYANARDSAIFIDSPTVELVEKKIISYITNLQDAENSGNINITLKSGVYVGTDEFTEYLQNAVPGFETNLDDLEELSPDDKVSLLLSKLASTVKSYIAHQDDTDVHVSADEKNTAKNNVTIEKQLFEKLIANAYITDDSNGKVYKVGSDNGKLYFDETDEQLSRILDEIHEDPVEFSGTNGVVQFSLVSMNNVGDTKISEAEIVEEEEE